MKAFVRSVQVLKSPVRTTVRALKNSAQAEQLESSSNYGFSSAIEMTSAKPDACQLVALVSLRVRYRYKGSMIIFGRDLLRDPRILGINKVGKSNFVRSAKVN